MTHRRALLLSALSGCTALSLELLWYRAYSIALMARPQAFGVVLGGYLLGIAAGAWAAYRRCARRPDRQAAVRALPWALLAAAAGAMLLVPVFARIVSVSRHWEIAVALIAAASTGLGAVLPLIAHASIASTSAVGARVSHVYAANILGSVVGTMLTGLVLMDRWGMAALLTTVVTAESGLAAWGFSALSGTKRVLGLALAMIVCVAAWGMRPLLYAQVFERLFFRLEFTPARSFSECVENRSGVIGVTSDGAVFGSGVYDGMFNVSLHRVGENFIQRAFAVAAFHPAPHEVLMIGLSSGSWAAVIANHPALEHLTIVEINPGYLPLLARHESSRGLLGDPKVHVDIDDGRHWLRRHPDQRFDLIVSNTTYHWRADASNLLSLEFMTLVRQHLKEGGVYYYNATSEPRAEKTGALAFPFAWRLYNMMAVSDRPLRPDLDRLGRVMKEYQIYGVPTVAHGSVADEQLRQVIVEDIAHDLEPRDRILARTTTLAPVTDDNMGTEWQLPARYRLEAQTAVH